MTTTTAMITPLTTTLYGSAAVHYARAVGVTLHRAKVLRAHGRVEPARTVTPDEATAVLQRDQSEARLITCTATHGERPYRSTGPIEIDWSSLHAVAIVVDAERNGADLCLGYDHLSDAFGGSYFPPSWEGDGLAGAVRILIAAQKIRAAAWETIHRARDTTDSRRKVTVAIRTALALDHLFRALNAIGVYKYEPASQICGITGYGPDDTMQVTGLRWARGAKERSAPPTMREVAEFLGQYTKVQS